MQPKGISMSNQDRSSTSPGPATPPAAPRRSRRGWVIGAIVTALVLVAGGKAYVYASGGGHGWRGHMSAEEMAEHIELRVKYALKDVDATEEQRAKVTGILQATATDVHTLAKQHQGMHQQLHEILTADSLDRARLEALRVEGLGVADQASKRLLQGVADAADVLTPEQRAQLNEKLEKRHRHWHDDGR
jgi:periplasmic protein CpxP/Spy